MVSPFVPRAVFPALDSLPRSYFLGHHRSGLTKMKSMPSRIDLIIECRDYRVPLTSTNPMFEESLAGRERLIVYTKKDLGRAGSDQDQQVTRAPVHVLIAAQTANTFLPRSENRLSGSGTPPLKSTSPTTAIRPMCVGYSSLPKNTPRAPFR